MGKCKQCGVMIRDNTNICPLCQCIIEQDSAVDNVYPDIWLKEKKIKLVGNICLFAIIALSVGMAIANYFIGDWLWCVIPIASLWIAYMILQLVVISSRGYRVKVMGPVILALVLIIIIDIMTEPFGWSVNYVFPGLILLTDVIVIIMMLVNKRRWQSYIIMQLGIAAISAAVLLVGWLVGLITQPLLNVIALAVSVLLFLGMLIIGDRAARGELKRRFHIR